MKKIRFTKNMLKTAAASVIAIGLCCAVYAGVNIAALVLAINEKETLPTVYENASSQTEESLEYIKADYTAVLNKLMPCTNTNAMSYEEAAELGAKYVWDMFQEDLSGTTIVMSYFVGPTDSKCYWGGDVYKKSSNYEDEIPYLSFYLGAVSGEWQTIIRDLAIDKSAGTFPFNEEEAENQYRDNCEEYLKAASDYAKIYFKTNIASAEFDGVAASVKYKSEYTDKNTGKQYHLAYRLYISVLVTDELGRQAELSITQDTKELESLTPMDPDAYDDPNLLG